MAIEDFEGVDFGDYTPSDKIHEFGGVGPLAKAYDELRSDNSTKIRVPGDDASEEDKTAFNADLRTRLGINPPETADGYSWKPPEGLEKQFEGMADEFKKYHEAGYDDATVSFMMQEKADALSAVQASMQDKQAEIAKEAETALKEKWGDNYEENMKAANGMESRFPELFDTLKAAGLVNHQATIETMFDVAMSVREDKPPANDPTVVKSLQEELKTLKADPSYMRGNHPDHHKTMSRVREIQANLSKQG